jgi:hypothetical protein
MIRILKQLFGGNKNSEWEAIKSSDKLYPPTSISLLKISSKNGSFSTGWVNKGYRDYPYKQYCKYNFLIKVNLHDKIATPNPNLDMETIENYFINNLQEAGVAHLVARLATAEGMNLEIYLENRNAAMVKLLLISENPNKPVSFSYQPNYDPDWKAVSGLMNL